jgi:hypothetical protein
MDCCWCHFTLIKLTARSFRINASYLGLYKLVFVVKMPSFKKFLRVFRSNRRIQFRTVFSLCILIIIWHVGFFEHLREIDFKRFCWPPYVNVSYQVNFYANNILKQSGYT